MPNVHANCQDSIASFMGMLFEFVSPLEINASIPIRVHWKKKKRLNVALHMFRESQMCGCKGLRQ